MNPTRKLAVSLSLLALALGSALPVRAAATRRRRVRRPMSEDAKRDYKANDMLNSGVELLGLNQEERGLKLIGSVPRMFPTSPVRFKAYLVLGQHYMGKRNFELAIKQFQQLDESETDEQKAEGLYNTGICYYNLNSFDKAFMSLRKVTNEFPWSVYANESFYYIGLCHFKLGRWSKAVEALEMVGTSVPANEGNAVLAEAGQRLFVKVHDKDLVVLNATGEKLQVELTAKSGDKETITLAPLGRSGEYFIGSAETDPGLPKPGDNKRQIAGGEEVTVHYVDGNTESGKRDEKRLATIRLVSSATVGFTDGAYREYTRGVFGGNDTFLRVKDLDANTSNETDKVTVKVYTQYTVKREADVERMGVEVDEVAEETVVRDAVDVALVETGPQTGIFVGSLVPKVVGRADEVGQGDDVLCTMKGDEMVVAYYDHLHLGGAEGRDVKTTARVLIGQIQDVKIEHREVDSVDLKARKNLIEAKIFLKLGSIFKDVGLTKKAYEKADEGMDRVEEVVRTSLKASLDRDIVEEAFSVKWELLLVQDKLGEAIGVCRTLTQLFPDSTLVDRALLKIGLAKMEGENPAEALRVFSGILRLPKSDLKAEAQYNIGVVQERMAEKAAANSERKPDLSRAMVAYKQCAENYPDSPFAGDALDKIASYYIQTKDYARALEMMERVFQDYPDASFLDKMLLKWVVVAYRMGNYPVAKTKVDQLLAEYPNSTLAAKARKFQGIIDKKLKK